MPESGKNKFQRSHAIHLPVKQDLDVGDDGGTCGTKCGGGMEKIYPRMGVRYGAMNLVGEFSIRTDHVFRCGGKVVIATERGTELGEQVSLTCNWCPNAVSREKIKEYVDTSGPEFYRFRSGRVLREATDEDLATHEAQRAEQRSDIAQCQAQANMLGLEMKVVVTERLLGDERLICYFQAEHRVDFRELVKRLSSRFATRVEMRQVGARDEARLVADWEICGRECCCKNFLKKLRPVSMKMAKLQKSTLDPSKVSGRCGRLRCCLRYEQVGYEELAKRLPKRKKRVLTPMGAGRVLDTQILTQLVLLKLDDGRDVTYPVEELDLTTTPPPPPAPSEDPRARRERSGTREGSGGREGSLRDSGPRDSATSERRKRRTERASETSDATSAPEADTGAPSAASVDTPAKESGAPVESAGIDVPAGEDGNADAPAKKRRRRRGRRRRSAGGEADTGGDAGATSTGSSESSSRDGQRVDESRDAGPESSRIEHQQSKSRESSAADDASNGSDASMREVGDDVADGVPTLDGAPTSNASAKDTAGAPEKKRRRRRRRGGRRSKGDDGDGSTRSDDGEAPSSGSEGGASSPESGS